MKRSSAAIFLCASLLTSACATQTTAPPKEAAESEPSVGVTIFSPVARSRLGSSTGAALPPKGKTRKHTAYRSGASDLFDEDEDVENIYPHEAADLGGRRLSKEEKLRLRLLRNPDLRTINRTYRSGVVTAGSRTAHDHMKPLPPGEHVDSNNERQKTRRWGTPVAPSRSMAAARPAPSTIDGMLEKGKKPDEALLKQLEAEIFGGSNGRQAKAYHSASPIENVDSRVTPHAVQKRKDPTLASMVRKPRSSRPSSDAVPHVVERHAVTSKDPRKYVLLKIDPLPYRFRNGRSNAAPAPSVSSKPLKMASSHGDESTPRLSRKPVANPQAEVAERRAPHGVVPTLLSKPIKR